MFGGGVVQFACHLDLFMEHCLKDFKVNFNLFNICLTNSHGNIRVAYYIIVLSPILVKNPRFTYIIVVLSPILVKNPRFTYIIVFPQYLSRTQGSLILLSFPQYLSRTQGSVILLSFLQDRKSVV